jgi:hypothetical protein
MDEKNFNPFIGAVDRLSYRIMGGMGRIFGSLSARDEEIYTYGIRSTFGDGFVDLAGGVGAIAAAEIPITQEADFIADRLLYVGVNPASGAILPYQVAGGPSLTLTMRDGGSDRVLTNFQLHVDTMAGSIQRSTPFPKRRVFRRNSTIFFDFTNLQAVATRVFVAILGYKIYDEASLDLVRRR